MWQLKVRHIEPDHTPGPHHPPRAVPPPTTLLLPLTGATGCCGQLLFLGPVF
jgi:hypothetical protein